MKKIFTTTMLLIFLFLSNTANAQWVQTNGPFGGTINSLAVSGTNIFAGTLDGVFLSTDNGSNWIGVNNGLSSTVVLSLLVSGTNIFAGTLDGGVFTSALSDIITDVKEISNSIPNNFVLSQNYPNPFNPSTIINFSLPKASFVTLKIYDVLGKEVATLVNEELKAGSYKFNFNANNLTSGIYFYRLQVYTPVHAGNFTQTKKMILLR